MDGELAAQEASSETSSDGFASEPSTARDVQGVHLDPGAPRYPFSLELPKLPLSPVEFTLLDWPKAHTKESPCANRAFKMHICTIGC